MTFNEAVYDLIKHLRLTYQAGDGTIYWYEGTIQLMLEVLGFLYEDLKAKEESEELEEPRCEFCGGKLSEEKEHEGKRYRHCYGCHFDYYITEEE